MSEQMKDLVELELDDVQKKTTSVKQTPAIPEKFKGKTFEDVLHSYTELERAFGKQSNEFGELRKVTDQILLKSLDSPSHKAEDKISQDPVSFDDLVDDPSATVDKLVSPKLKQINDKLNAIEQKERLGSFKSQFPNYNEDLADDAFKSWVNASPYRVKLLQNANNNFDVDAGVELWSNWAERKELVQSAHKQETEELGEQRQQALKKATTESTSISSAHKKGYRRVDIVRLRAENPDRYMELLPSIRKAYQEGRVI